MRDILQVFLVIGSRLLLEEQVWVLCLALNLAAEWLDVAQGPIKKDLSGLPYFCQD